MRIVTFDLSDGSHKGVAGGVAGQFLKTDESGNFVWATPTTGTIISQSGNYTVTDSDNARTVSVTTGASDITIALPTALDNTDRIITIKKIDSGTGKVIVDGEGAEEVDGQTTIDLRSQYDFITVQSDGTSWFIISKSIDPFIADVSSAYTAVNNDLVLADTTSSTFTVTLPASPSVGDKVVVYDKENNFGTAALTLDGNGSDIEGSSDNYSLSTAGSKSECIYVGGSLGWKITATS